MTRNRIEGTPTQPVELTGLMSRLDLNRSKSVRSPSRAGDPFYVVPVLVKAIAILELLRNSEGALRADDIHKATGFARSTVYRILRTFLMSGYLAKVNPGQYVFKQDPRSPIMDGVPSAGR